MCASPIAPPSACTKTCWVSGTCRGTRSLARSFRSLVGVVERKLDAAAPHARRSPLAPQGGRHRAPVLCGRRRRVLDATRPAARDRGREGAEKEKGRREAETTEVVGTTGPRDADTGRSEWKYRGKC